MGRAIGSVVLGYIAMAVVVFICMSVAYLLLGTEGSFKAGSYEVSGAWLVVTVVVGLGAAILGGFVCAAVAKTVTPPRVLAAAVLVLGLAMAMPALTESDADVRRVREGGVAIIDAAQEAIQPGWVALLNPLIGAIGVLVGAGLRRGERAGVPKM
ncbi:MAG: hypothetical protein JSU87_02615 [Gemmatimonadota bacterium]|nr:MAG: hypothetical protein JSU87_02615 [Gemmatimonadota bacterium]